MIEKDRELLASVAIHNPHLAGTVLRLCNDLEDAARLGELPPPELLQRLGAYLQAIGGLVNALAGAEARTYRDEPVVIPGGD